jgi:hypothetical protein
MEPDVEAIRKFICESPDADESYRTMLKFVIRAGEQVLGPERADATLDEMLLDESAAQAERLCRGYQDRPMEKCTECDAHHTKTRSSKVW